MVRVPSSTRGPAAWRVDGWWRGANRKTQLAARRMLGSSAIGASTLTPSAASTSAPPVREDSARLPCLATGTPAPATTKVTAVETFNVPALSPPVPQTSMAPSGAVMAVMRLRMARTAPVSSATVSPRTRIAMSRAPIWAGVASPDMMMSKAVSASAADSVSREARRARIGFRFLDTLGGSGVQAARAGWLLPRASARKLASSVWPCSEAMLSGWNCTP